MSTPVQTDKLEAFRQFMRAHAAITHRLDADLVSTFGLTLHDYEVLYHLSIQPGGRLRPSELTDRVMLTRSGVTRLLAGLEEAGFVSRHSCQLDRRVIYAVLTDEGRAKYHEVRPTALSGVNELFVDRYEDDELDRLGELLTRLPGCEIDTPCDVD